MSTPKSSDHHLVLFGLGALAGALSGRLLPIFLAIGNGAARSALGQDPFAGLIRQHRQLLELLDRMNGTSHSNCFRRATLAYLFKRKIAKHAMAEEDVVYPMLAQQADRAEAARKLYEEHGRMKVLLFQLEQSVADDARWFAAVHGLRQEIEPHARQEEEVEFPALRNRLDKGGRIKLSGQIHREEAVIV